ncbi:MAG TPA: hypothetical protein PLR93_00400, partial [Anaerolineales bacterium]|nr:hypothetical protein [Anaerolineales bacterium]
WFVIQRGRVSLLGFCLRRSCGYSIFETWHFGWQWGLATAGGSVLALNPLAFVICLGLLILLVLVVRHSARASVFAGILFAPVLWLLSIRDVAFWVAVGAGAVIAVRFLIDWNRKYRELWLDREKKSEKVEKAD